MILQPDSVDNIKKLESDPKLRQDKVQYDPPIVLAIHGGAGGTIPPNLPAEMEAQYRAKLRDSLIRGYEILNAGGTALDAVCAAVVEMEDCELFNAAKGAVFNASGENECEASVMVAGPPLQRGTLESEEKSEKGTETQESFSSSTSISQSRRGAAVTLVRQTKNPILLAKALYENPSDNPHVLMSGEAAEEIGWRLGCEKVGKDYYWTKRRWLEHRRGLGLPDDESDLVQEEGEEVNRCETESVASMPPTTSSPPSYTSLQKPTTSSLSNSQTSQRTDLGGTDSSRATASLSEIDVDLDCLPKGTVGAVALDRSGRLACATSTGGKTNKLKGRIGDTPSIGSGFWAEVWKSDQMNISSSSSSRDSAHQDSDQDQDSDFCSRLFSCFSSNPRETQIEDEELANVNKPVTRPPTFTGLEGVAVSGTGDGDYFLRISFASLVAHRMRLRGETSEVAGKKAIEELTQVGGKGTGGSIILDLKGKVSFPMNSATMNRGFISSESGAVPRVAIFDYETCK